MGRGDWVSDLVGEKLIEEFVVEIFNNFGLVGNIGFCFLVLVLGI